MKSTSINILAVFISAGLFLLGVILLKGNWLVLAGPFALWIYTRLHASTGIEITSPKKNNSNVLRNPKVIIAIAIWGAISYLFVQETRDLYLFKQYAKNEISQAQQLIKSGQFGKAIAILENTNLPAQNARLNAEKYHNLGVLYLNAGQADKAYECLLNTLTYNHSNPEACYLLACICYDGQFYTESLLWLNTAKRLGCTKPKMSSLKQKLLERLNKSG